MALVDRALRWKELGEDYHRRPGAGRGIRADDTADNIQATGFLEHIKLPHYVDFQAELELVRHCGERRSSRARPLPKRAA